MTAEETGLVVVRTSFFAGNTLVKAGDVWTADDPVVKHNPTAFRPLVVQRSKVERPSAPPSPRGPLARRTATRSR